MTRSLALLFSLLLWSVVHGLAQLVGGHLSIDAHEIAGGQAIAVAWSTSWGSYDLTRYSHKAIEVTVHNLGRAPATAHVTISFFDVYFNEVGKADADLDLSGKLFAKAVLNVPTVVTREINYAALGQGSVEGKLPPAGWCATGRLDGKIFGLRASNGSLQAKLERDLRDGKLR